MHHRRDAIQLWILVAILSVTLLLPIWLTVQGAFVNAKGSFSLTAITGVLADPYLMSGLQTSLLIAVGTTLLSLLIGVPLAYLAARTQFPGKRLFGAIVLVPMILPPFVGAIGFRHLLDRGGSLDALCHALGLPTYDFFGDGGLGGIILVEALHLYPIIYLNVLAVLANLDPALDEAARGMGVPPWKRLLRVTLPLARPGLFAGATLVFVWSFTELGTPLMFEYRGVTPVQIFDGLKGIQSSRDPYALTVVMLSISIVIYLVGKTIFGRPLPASAVKASIRGEDIRLSGWRAGATTALFALVTGLAIIPHLGVILASLGVAGSWQGTVLPTEYTTHYFSDAMSHPLTVGAMRNSIGLSLAAVTIDLGLGLLIARLLVRSRVRGKMLLDGLSMLPLAVPGLVMAFGFIALSLSWPFGGLMPGWLASILPAGLADSIREAPLASVGTVMGADPNPFPFLAIAYAVRRLPYVVRAASAGLEQTPEALEEAAAMTGASRWLTMRKVVAPLVAANLIAGGMLAFAFSMLEVSDSLLLAQREADFPITKAIYSLHERLGDGDAVASALGVWAMALLTATLVGASLMMGKRLGAVFRG
ncbi:MAG: iron ABC transporter permease [Planctomycetota bacterium]|nr:iron ABC transporter permease [Planctomycetota bacterium]MDA1105558.1 iron ABC transporter permease [Planctomycetota bacterium]